MKHCLGLCSCILWWVKQCHCHIRLFSLYQDLMNESIIKYKADVFFIVVETRHYKSSFIHTKHKMTHMLKKRLSSYFSCLHCLRAKGKQSHTNRVYLGTREADSQTCCIRIYVSCLFSMFSLFLSQREQLQHSPLTAVVTVIHHNSNQNRWFLRHISVPFRLLGRGH